MRKSEWRVEKHLRREPTDVSQADRPETSQPLPEVAAPTTTDDEKLRDATRGLCQGVVNRSLSSARSSRKVPGKVSRKVWSVEF